MLRDRNYSAIEDIEIEPDLHKKWRTMLDLIAEITHVPAALILCAHEIDIEVFVKSNGMENVYREGERIPLNTGRYGEAVITLRDALNIKNALGDKTWRDSPDAALGIIAFLGFPVFWPDGEIFGAICVLDTQERLFSQSEQKLLGLFAGTIQNGLAALTRQSDKALQVSETRLKRAQALAHVGNWEIDLTGRQMWASEEAFRIYGLPYEGEIIPLEVAQRIVLSEDRPMMDEALMKLIGGHAKYDAVYRIHRQNDAQVRTLHSIAELELDCDKRPLRVVGVVQDITEAMQAQKKLAESEQVYRALFTENPAPQLVLDTQDGRITDANPAAVRFYGYTREELIGKPITEINGLPIEKALENVRLAFDRKKPRYEASHKLADGTWREVEAFSGPVEIGNQKCVNYIIHDITDRKQAEAQLRESEARFRQFVESAPDGVFVQTTGRFAYVNHKMLQLLGAASEPELLGRSVPPFFAEDCREQVVERIRMLNEECRAVPLTEEAVLRMDGSRVEVEVSAVPIRYEGQNGALVFMRDITERRQLENVKTEMEAQLQQKQRLESIGLLAGGVAHEINNPLNGIINYAQLILEGETDEVPEYSREIIREGQRIGEIVRNLLKFSRHEKQSHSPARIEDIVNETLSLIRTLMRHDQIALEIDIPDDLPSIKCRSQQIQQVLMNLFTNARDALNARYKGFHEDKVIRAWCCLFERGGRRWIRLTVEDQGIGISDAIRDKIFDPFFTTKPRDEGTGLGLSISHGIVKDHHGELYFETEPGKYTRAILELPVDNGWNLEG